MSGHWDVFCELIIIFYFSFFLITDVALNLQAGQEYNLFNSNIIRIQLNHSTVHINITIPILHVQELHNTSISSIHVYQAL